jgi:hypothetical protein
MAESKIIEEINKKHNDKLQKKGDVYDFMLFFDIFSILPIKA